MKNFFTVLLLAAIWPLGLARAAEAPVIFPTPLSPRIANYRIDATLDPADYTLRGHEIITFRNDTPNPTRELWLHLYLNAFRNTESTWVKEEGADGVADMLEPDGWGYIEIERIGAQSGEDLSGAVRYERPDDGNTADKTVLVVTLPRPLGPGQTLELAVDFAARLPSPPVARTGCVKDYCFAGQWFPKVGVLEDRGWNCHQFHANSEFHADFGVYDVRLTVPEKNVVGATGVLVERVDNGDGTATHYYHAEDVHDFAWVTSPDFVEFVDRAQDVEIRLLMHQEHQAQAERHMVAAKHAVTYFQDWYGDYPYPNLTVVDPRRKAGATGGMEYPTLITAGTMTIMPKGVHAPEVVIIHEFGHNFWYGLVANNEMEHAWLDEGITTYSEIKIMHDLYDPKISAAKFLGLKIDDLSMRRHGYVTHADLDPLDRPAWLYYSGGSYGANAYDKGAMMMLTLEGHIGQDVMDRLMRTWFARFKFKHPTSADFIATANEVSGRDLTWFFNQALSDKVILDYAVTALKSKPVGPGKGYDYTKTPAAESAAPDDAPALSDTLIENVVKVRRLGDFRFPVEVEVEFDDGEVVRESWDGEGPWIEYRYFRYAKLVRATVDPDAKVFLDVNWKNNALTMKQQKRLNRKGGGGYPGMVKYALDPY